MQQSRGEQRPKQARALKTEQKLIDALEKLLAEKSFAQLTVSELAQEAGVTTGAIYRRFVDKEDLLRSAFDRLLQRTRIEHGVQRPENMSDMQFVRWYLCQLMDFMLDNIHLMGAADSLNDMEPFDRMNHARAIGADWLAARIHNSNLPEKELAKRSRFIMRIATATFRDTFLSGRGAVVVNAENRLEYEAQLVRLCAKLGDMAGGYLALAEEQ